jgi:Serine acetyltransferase, N-terminal
MIERLLISIVTVILLLSPDNSVTAFFSSSQLVFRPSSSCRERNVFSGLPTPAMPNQRVLFSEKQVQHGSHEVKVTNSTSSTNNGGAGRRVLRLINKVNDRMLEKDFAGPIWDAIRYEASAISEGDLKAATLMSNFILNQPSLDEAVMEFVANQLEQPLFQATQIRNLFAEICEKNPQMASYWALDLMASAMRDNSQPNAVSVLLFNKGFHSLVTYRIANALWHEGRDGLAIYFQSLSSRTFGSDIHPACTIGYGCSLSSGTGVVIGETAVIGNDCYISHDVTLGGNGKQKGDRHPKVRNGALPRLSFRPLDDAILYTAIDMPFLALSRTSAPVSV